MEMIRGKASREIGFDEFKRRLTGYDGLVLDIGTGDGRFVQALAGQRPGCFVVGMDACRENLREFSRLERPNALFVIAEAAHMPQELTGLASGIALNFPWGSLLEGLLSADPALFQALERAAGRRASLEVRLNAGALAEAGITLQAGADQIHSNLLRSGWMASSPRLMEIPAMRTFPSTWARRLAHGRDPRALEIHAQRVHHAFRS